VERFVRVLSASLLASVLFAGEFNASSAAASTAPSTYIVLYKQKAVPADASARLAAAGGLLVHAYTEIGVAIARSNNPRFRESLTARDARIQDVGSTATARIRLKVPQTERAVVAPLAEPVASVPVDLTTLQWDMRQIHAIESHAISGGRPSVLVGDIDTGVDFRHPDLKANIDFDNSVSCIDGIPDQSPAAWDDDVGHGTHTAGTIVGAGTGLGIVGVAPNVRLAAIKAGDANGFFFPEAVVCAFIWAATHHVNITNNSYFADPFYFNCPNEPDQAAILIAEQRAIEFAQWRGVAVVASLDNFSDDLANPTRDRHSPTNGIPTERPVDRSCLVIPAEVPGVIGVSSTGNQGLKAATSNYGLGIADLAAPGGDSRLQPAPAAEGGGRVLSTWPAKLINACARRVTLPTSDPDEPLAVYCYQQGTSMAAAHVSGVAALVMSNLNNRGQSGLDDGQLSTLRLLLRRTADPIGCPPDAVLALYAPYKALDNDAVQTCEERGRNNSWYGSGQVNALTAVRAAIIGFNND
jgi:subtilisin family serine protease